jgi:hypothetical protein
VADVPQAGADSARRVREAAPCADWAQRHPVLAALWPYGALLLFTAGLLWPLCLGRRLYWGDILLYFDVMLRFVRAALRQGQLPLWNPYLLCGQPYVGNPQTALFYPVTALLPFVPVWLFLSLNSVLHLFLCGAFTYRFLQRWTLRRISALSGALVYMGSACLLGRLQFPPMIQTAAYFPLVLACLDACIDAPGPKSGFGLAIVIGLMLLAAHAQVAYLIVACAASYAILRLWATHRQARRAKETAKHAKEREKRFSNFFRIFRVFRGSHPLNWMLAAGALGLLLAAAQLLPALQLLRESPREEMTFWQANRFVLEPVQLLTLIAPHFLGHPASADYGGSGNAWEPALFIGWLPLLLIGYAVARCNREGLVRYWAIVALLGIWLALGNVGGLYWVAFHSVPGLSHFHDPARFLLITTFAFAVLTGIGLDALRVRRGNVLASLGALAAIAAPLLWYGPEWNPTVPPQLLAYRPAVVPVLQKETASGTPDAGRIYLPEHELFWNQYITAGYRDYGPSDARSLDAFLDTLMPNLGMRYGLEAASSYEPVPVAAMADLDGLARIALRRGQPNLTRILDLLDVDIVALPKALRLTDPELRRLAPSPTVRSLSLWHPRSALPRAWLVRRTRRVEGKLRISAALAAPDFQPAEMAIISGGSPPQTPWERRSPRQESAGTTRADLEWGTFTEDAGLPAPVTMQARSARIVQLQADAGLAPAFLVYSGTAYPGWKATIDGQPTPVYRTDGALLGVYLPPGKHVVRLMYSPAAFRIGLYLSLVACAILAAGAGTLFIFRNQAGTATEIETGRKS